MTIALNLSPDLEAKLHNKASQEGEETHQVITELLITLLEWETEDTKEAIQGIQRGLTDFELGNYQILISSVAETVGVDFTYDIINDSI